MVAEVVLEPTRDPAYEAGDEPSCPLRYLYYGCRTGVSPSSPAYSDGYSHTTTFLQFVMLRRIELRSTG